MGLFDAIGRIFSPPPPPPPPKLPPQKPPEPPARLEQSPISNSSFRGGAQPAGTGANPGAEAAAAFAATPRGPGAPVIPASTDANAGINAGVSGAGTPQPSGILDDLKGLVDSAVDFVTGGPDTNTPPPVFQPGQELPDDATVVQLDFFKQDHGGNVAEVLDANGQLTPDEIARVEVSGANGASTAGMSYEDRIATGMVNGMATQSTALEAIAADPKSVRVVNASVGQDLGNTAQNTIDQMQTPAGVRRLTSDLGLPPGTDEGAVLQRALDVQARVARENPAVLAAKQRLERAVDGLEAQGIAHVVAAGNNGDLAASLTEKGYELDRNFTDNMWAAPKSITVGASNGPTAAGGIASFSSANPDTDIAMDGVEVPLANGSTVNGTSFAAPTAAAVADDMMRLNPDLTPQQVRDLMQDSATPTGAGSAFDGDGVVDANRARQLAIDSEPSLQEKLVAEVERQLGLVGIHV